MRQGRFRDVEAYDLKVKAGPPALEALTSAVEPPMFDSAATQRYMQFALVAAKRGNFETADRFAGRAGRILCFMYPKAKNGGLWRAWFTRNIFVQKAVEEGRLSPVVLNQF